VVFQGRKEVVEILEEGERGMGSFILPNLPFGLSADTGGSIGIKVPLV
jgi:hypothetical protein